MARTKASEDATPIIDEVSPVDEHTYAVERIETSKAYRFASARTLTNTEEDETVEVEAGKYMKLIGFTNDDRVVVVSRKGVEYVAPTNILDRAI